MLNLKRRISWLTLYALAMGFMEAAVVIYLRRIYYPNGFQFPLVQIDETLAAVEFFREAATIIMLAAIGILAGKTASQKFAVFLYCFAVWDLAYYLFLKIILGWPPSLLTWDILFLIPIPWVGPVLAPCILSVTMIVLTAIVIYVHEAGIDAHLRQREWLLLISGSIIVILSFMIDFLKYLLDGGNPSDVLTLSNKKSLSAGIINYVPHHFQWLLFLFGELVIAAGIVSFLHKACVTKRRQITQKSAGK